MTYYGTKKSILGKKKPKNNNTNSILKRKKKQEELINGESLKQEPINHDPGWYFNDKGEMVYRLC